MPKSGKQYLIGFLTDDPITSDMLTDDLITTQLIKVNLKPVILVSFPVNLTSRARNYQA